MRSRTLIILLAVVSLFLSTGVPPVLAVLAVECISVTDNGTPGNNDSSFNDRTRLSSDGRFAAFASNASNLVKGDTNGCTDIFVRDRQSNATTRISLASSGSQGNGNSFHPDISADGRYIVFASKASNLVSGDTNGCTDIFLHDRQSRAITRLSTAFDGSESDNSSFYPCISADGHYVAFVSNATNLVRGDNNTCTDVFIRDLQANTTSLVSLTSDGLQANDDSSAQDWPDISADGRYIAFTSTAKNLAEGDTYSFYDVFVRDRQARLTTRVSVASNGTQATGMSGFPCISADGRFVAFWSRAPNLVKKETHNENIFLHDCQDNTTALISIAANGFEARGNSFQPDISADGRYVVFFSGARGLVQGDSNGCHDIFVYDRRAGTNTRVSITADDREADGASCFPCISADGRYVAFASQAGNLAKEDAGGFWDVFVTRLLPDDVRSSPLYTGSGIVKFNVDAGTISSLSNHYAAGVRCTAPSGSVFRYDVFSFEISRLAPGQQVSVTMTFPSALPLGTNYYRCNGGTLVDLTPQIRRVDSSTLILTLTDGGPDDADGVINGTITALGGPVFSNGEAPALSGRAAPQAPAPDIVVTGASLSSMKAKAGAPVTVTASAVNKGSLKGPCMIRVYVNGTEEASQEVNVNCGEAAQVKFVISRSEPGTYSVYVGDKAAGAFTVDQSVPDFMIYINAALALFIVAGIVILIQRRKKTS